MENKFADSQVDECSLEQQKIIKSILKLIGENPEREGLIDTPKRVLKSYRELFGGYNYDPVKILGTTFKAPKDSQMVICKDIELYSTCEHHMIPFYGKVHIGYIPTKRVVGLSKLARLADIFARRLQIQEQLTDQIADTLNKVLKPKGVIVIIEAKHMCMCARGVGKQNSLMVTSAIRGLFKNQSTREEFLSLIK